MVDILKIAACVVVASVLLPLAGCVSRLANVPFDQSTETLPPDSGVVVFSLTARGGGTVNVRLTDDMGYLLGIVSHDSEAVLLPPVFIGNMQLTERPVGRLVVLTLPEGRYVIPAWRGTYQGESRMGGTIEGEFKPGAGELLYLGNVHVEFPGGNVSVTDRADRDLDFISRRYPGLGELPIRIHLLNTTASGK